MVLLFAGAIKAQIPVEVFAGNQKTTFDAMYFKFFLKESGKPSPFLFFSRTRAALDYQMTSNTNLPSIGMTEAISYNHARWKGFAPVAVAQVFSKSAFAKVGLQYARMRKNITIFSWAVLELEDQPAYDIFLLCRYTPLIVGHSQLFSQLESVNSFPTKANLNYSLTQRLRLGLQRNHFQFGLGAEFNQSPSTETLKSAQFGCFLRYEFQ
jgi:hypothetical protein